MADTMTAEEARLWFDYDPETGALRWKKRRGQKMHAGFTAGGIGSKGYLQVSFDRRKILAHRLAWLIVHGEWPAGLIDHINQDKTDNRLCNLRVVDARENGANRPDNVKAGTGKGYSFHRKTGKWQAQVTIAGKLKYLGLFASEEEAAKAVRQVVGGDL